MRVGVGRQRIKLGGAEGEKAFKAVAARGIGRDFRAAAWAGRLRCRLASHYFHSVLRQNGRKVTGNVRRAGFSPLHRFRHRESRETD